MLLLLLCLFLATSEDHLLFCITCRHYHQHHHLFSAVFIIKKTKNYPIQLLYDIGWLDALGVVYTVVDKLYNVRFNLMFCLTKGLIL